MKNYSKKSKVVVIACCYRINPLEMLSKVKYIFRSYDAEFHYYIISSKIMSKERIDESSLLIPADNQDFDFSSYFTGANIVQEFHSDATAIIFLNDTLFTNHCAAANIRALWMQKSAIEKINSPSIAGKADKYQSVCLKNPWSNLNIYITTYCFMLNTSGLNAMSQLRFHAENDFITHRPTISDDNWGKFLNSTFLEFIKCNILYKNSPYLWYRLKERNYTIAELTSKARTIYFEHRLSGEIGKHGCILISNYGRRWKFYLEVCELIFKKLPVLNRFF